MTSDKGVISEINDLGTVVVVTIRTDDGHHIPVFFDHRSYRQMVALEGRLTEGLIGRRVKYEDGWIIFLDRVTQ